MRRPVKKKKILSPDFVYNSTKVEKFINYVMKRGQKETARGIVYDAFDIVKEKEKTDNPLEVFDKAIKNVGPLVEIRSRRIGGANYMVPREVKAERRFSLAMRWILEAARGRKGSPMREKLAEELIAASKGQGPAVTKRENTHKMAEANKAFAHFSW
ncbi:MAG: 30S ribosomal protein S7 [Parcubacteria group bacterium]|nr:30S ribosomal protein S7 [Parcubacteria group bacterium]